MSVSPAVFAIDRPSLHRTPDLDSYASLTAAWTRTRRTLQRIREHLTAAQLDTQIVTVAVSGSLGRMEQVDQSDADLIVVVRGDTSAIDAANRRAYVEQVWAAIEPLQLARPEADGIYSEAVGVDQITGTRDLGKIDESPFTFGKRIQLLLDAQPVYQSEACEHLLAGLLARYAADDGQDANEWSYLLNDLIRYYRCLAINAQWRNRQQAAKWRLIHIKYGHSRRLLYAGLLLLLGHSAGMSSADRQLWLQQQLKLTPIERVASVYRAQDDSRFAIVGACYDRFLAAMSETPPLIKQLEDADDTRRLDDHPKLQTLDSNANDLAAELTRFVFSMRGRWSESFVNRVIF